LAFLLALWIVPLDLRTATAIRTQLLVGAIFFGTSRTHRPDRWLLCGYFLRLDLEKSPRDGKSTKALAEKTAA
jgi:hypothetical protein